MDGFEADNGVGGGGGGRGVVNRLKTLLESRHEATIRAAMEELEEDDGGDEEDGRREEKKEDLPPRHHRRDDDAQPAAFPRHEPDRLDRKRGIDDRQPLQAVHVLSIISIAEVTKRIDIAGDALDQHVIVLGGCEVAARRLGLADDGLGEILEGAGVGAGAGAEIMDTGGAGTENK